MQHWGWIPQFQGSGGVLSGHNYGSGGPTQGLTFIYDPIEAYPYDNGSTHSYIRTDSNGDYLPFAPKLPVCPGYVYEDEVNGETPVS